MDRFEGFPFFVDGWLLFCAVVDTELAAAAAVAVAAVGEEAEAEAAVVGGTAKGIADGAPPKGIIIGW